MLNGRLDNLLTAGVDRGDVPGVVAIVVSSEGTLYEGAFGERALGGGVSMTKALPPRSPCNWRKGVS
ncbi:MAG: hypothetical protein VCE75_06865 [Alphaproteobacteria bacterium]|jgi:hypothetical protein